ncbi:MAG TPA: hypothetical protein VJQ83_11710 [Tepidiformaceae bacterium]|nr:hypothetical protein [Tepidiformaceae bacterium]
MTNLRQLFFHECGGFNRRSVVAALIGSAVVSLAIQGAIAIAFG